MKYAKIWRKCTSVTPKIFGVTYELSTMATVVMKFKSILDLEQYLYSVSTELHTNLFEIVPLQLNKHTASKTIAKCIRDKEYQKKRLNVTNSFFLQLYN